MLSIKVYTSVTKLTKRKKYGRSKRNARNHFCPSTGTVALRTFDVKQNRLISNTGA